MSDYLSSNDERLYAALEGTYGQVLASSAAQTHSADEAGNETGSRDDGAAGQDRKQDVSRVAEHDPQGAHHFSVEHADDGGGRIKPAAPVTAPCFEGSARRDAAALCGRDGGIGHKPDGDSVYRRTRFDAGTSDYFRRGDSVCRGGAENSTTVFINAAVHGYPDQRGRHDDLQAGGSVGECEPLRLLGSEHQDCNDW